MTSHERSAPTGLGDIDGRTDDLFDVLSDSRRRFVVACLETHSEPMPVADVAAELTRWECDTQSDDLSDERVETRHLALYHVHFPKMADAGVLEWDRDGNTVALTDERGGIPSGVALPSIE